MESATAVAAAMKSAATVRSASAECVSAMEVSATAAVEVFAAAEVAAVMEVAATVAVKLAAVMEFSASVEPAPVIVKIPSSAEVAVMEWSPVKAAAEPRTGADEDAAGEPLRPVVAIRRARVWVVSIIAVRAHRRTVHGDRKSVV